jgi:hypothetical protein
MGTCSAIDLNYGSFCVCEFPAFLYIRFICTSLYGRRS